MEDLEEAIRVWRQAVNLTPQGHPDRPMYLNNLGNGLSDRYARTGRMEDLEEATRHWQGAIQPGREVALEVALVAARNWGNSALERRAWEEAVRAYVHGREAVDRLLQAQARQQGKEAWLREAQTLPDRYAYALARLECLTEAVEILEWGRAVLLREALERNRGDLERLADLGHGELLERYRAADDRLAALERQREALAATGELERPALDYAAWRREVEAARAELDALIAEIQGVDGYGYFLRSPDFDRVAQTAAGAPLVYLLATPAGGLGLVVYGGRATPIFLDDLTEEAVDEWLLQRDEQGNVVGGYLPAQLTGYRLEETVANLLPHLGQALVPLWDYLVSFVPRPSSLTLIPTGRLALLPWHAALHPAHDRALLDDVAVAYAVSAHVLHHLRAAEFAWHPDEGAALLAVGNPTEDLRYAALEARSIAEVWPREVHLLMEGDATRAAVWADLAGARVAHFATHGTFDPADPQRSALLLAEDTRLTLRDLLDAGPEVLGGLRLVVLSACQTAIPDFQDLPNEVIGLPAGFHQAGVPGVVGSLWPVNDVSAALLMVRFYEYWLGHGPDVDSPLPPAQALAAAQRWLRDATYDDLNAYLDHHRRLREQVSEGTRMPYLLISELRPTVRHAQLSGRANERPYRSPYHWAGFVYYGRHAESPSPSEVS